MLAARLPGAALGVVLLSLTAGASADTDAALANAAKQVFDTRCVACHSCYNAPCQLDLTSFEGIARGATEARVYNATRLEDAPPTRLSVDAHGEAEWRRRGFFSVLEPLDSDSPAYSVFGRMLALKRAFPMRRVREKETWMCPANVAEMALYSALGRDGMPHGFAQLDEAEYGTVMRWLAAGASLPADRAAPIDADARAQLAAWERLLNTPGPRHRLVARYLYEHLFLAHLYLESAPGAFFRLVRSRTAAPAAVREIASVRPYDDPGTRRFYYRFVPITRTLVHKTHITFKLSPARLKRYRTWFLGTPWTLAETALPGYQPATSANPFKTFEAIPARARYRFLLDNARYFVMSFIRGPVCEGQMAVNVINDQFHVLFLDPDRDLSVTDPSYLRDSGALLTLPAAGADDPFETYYFTYKKHQRAYTAFREQRYAGVYPRGMDMSAIWDGARSDPDAALTVMRHFDNAAVVHGLRGPTPKTLWVIDYPILERIYYLLVAGFNVYGNVFHQAATRLYMDNLRIESEDLFLGFLPPAVRRPLRAYWYRGMLARLKMEQLNPLRGADRPSAVVYGGGDPKETFIELAKTRLGAALHQPEPLLNVATGAPAGDAEPARARVERLLNRLTARNAPFVAVMPDLSYLLVDFDDGTELYALIRNKAHLNVAFPLAESDRRVPAEDTLMVLRGVAGSYPNFLFSMKAAEVAPFVSLLEGWSGRADEHDALFRRFGVSRYRADFWREFDRLNRAVMSAEGVAGARLDLGKYVFR